MPGMTQEGEIAYWQLFCLWPLRNSARSMRQREWVKKQSLKMSRHVPRFRPGLGGMFMAPRSGRSDFHRSGRF